VNGDKQEMNESSLLTLLEEYKNEKIKTMQFQWKWMQLLNYCHCFGNQMQVSIKN